MGTGRTQCDTSGVMRACHARYNTRVPSRPGTAVVHRLAQATSARRRLAVSVGAVAVLSLIFAIWPWTPLGEFFGPADLHELLSGLSSATAGAALLALFMLGAAIFFPVTPLIVLAMIIFGPAWGGLWSLAGLLLAAQVGFSLGRSLGRRDVIQLREGPIYRASRFMRERGLLKTAILRVLPVAHFPAISFLLGVSHLRWGAYMVGTLSGSTVTIAVMALMYDRTAAAISSPSAERLAILGVITIILVGMLVWLQRRGRSLIEEDRPIPQTTPGGPDSC